MNIVSINKIESNELMRFLRVFCRRHGRVTELKAVIP